MPSRWLNPMRSDQFCHCSRLPSSGERRTLGLGDVQRFERLAARRRADAFRDVPRHVFAHHLGFDAVATPPLSSTRSTPSS